VECNAWYTKDLRDLGCKQIKLHNTAKSCQTTEAYAIAKEAKKHYNVQLKVAKKKYFENIFKKSKSGPQKMWKALKSYLPGSGDAMLESRRSLLMGKY
jgi:hypothetical protein